MIRLGKKLHDIREIASEVEYFRTAASAIFPKIAPHCQHNQIDSLGLAFKKTLPYHTTCLDGEPVG